MLPCLRRARPPENTVNPVPQRSKTALKDIASSFRFVQNCPEAAKNVPAALLEVAVAGSGRASFAHQENYEDPSPAAEPTISAYSPFTSPHRVPATLSIQSIASAIVSSTSAAFRHSDSPVRE